MDWNKKMLLKNVDNAALLKELSSESKRLYFIQRFLNNKQNKKVLYVHVPFCVSKCKYCVYSSVVAESDYVIEQYVNEIFPKHIEQYQAAFKQTKFEQVYFGGGTPTILNAFQMEKIFEMIPGFKEISIKCIEASPFTLSSEHLQLLKKYNFSFLSIGIQTLKHSTLKKYNRTSITKTELERLCRKLNNNNLFFNLDLICYLDKGDIRDLPGFEMELRYIIENCSPSSITIHQHYQSFFSKEKTYYLLSILKKVLLDYKNYECANSPMLRTDDEITMDTMFQAEYRLIRKEKGDFQHYMWDKYALLPVKGYDILSIGYTKNCHTTSNVNNLVYIASTNELVYAVE